jgi:hypothetical protein
MLGDNHADGGENRPTPRPWEPRQRQAHRSRQAKDRRVCARYFGALPQQGPERPRWFSTSRQHRPRARRRDPEHQSRGSSRGGAHASPMRRGSQRVSSRAAPAHGGGARERRQRRRHRRGCRIDEVARRADPRAARMRWTTPPPFRPRLLGTFGAYSRDENGVGAAVRCPAAWLASWAPGRGLSGERRRAGRACGMGCEPDLLTGRPCDSPGCAASTDPSVSFCPPRLPIDNHEGGG